MSFFDNLWGGIKNIGSGVFNAGKGLLSKFAPAVGGIIGQRFGVPDLGSSLGQVVGGLAGGNGNSYASGLSGVGGHLGHAGGADIVGAMPSWVQNSRANELAGNAGSRGGAWLGGQAANLLPQALQHLAPTFQQFGADVGRAGGNLFNKHVVSPNISPQTGATTIGHMPRRIGSAAGVRAYNRSDLGKQAAAENMQHFAELPGGFAAGGYAGGGYTDPNMIQNHHAMHTMPYYGGGHGPVMMHEGGYAMGGFPQGGFQQNTMGGFPQNSYAPLQTYAQGGYAGGGQPISLHELVEMLPFSGGH